MSETTNEPLLHHLQQFETRTISRKEIKNAPYNPRKITEANRARLQELLQEFGLVETLVWNKQTGNLVGGHQRLSILDALSETGEHYLLTVSVVDLDTPREIALNLSLNAKAAQGDFDTQSVDKLLKEIQGKIALNLQNLFAGKDKKAARLKKLTIKPPPKMAWALIGIPMVRYNEIAASVEAIAAIPETIVESTFNDGNKHKDGQSQSSGEA